MMEEKIKVPMLLEFLFADAAETALRGASPRLILWAAAFDQWLAERGRVYKPCTTKQSKLALRRLLRQRRLMPWEMNQEHIQGHVAWMQAQGFAASTIYNALGTIAQFFRWCDERQIDPECEPGFNPAAGVVRPRIKIYAHAQLLSRGELRALLGILRQDDSPLGKRDYAFILARLRMGVPLKALLQLQWGQIEGDEDSAWVRWRPEAARTQLPGEVWDAIRGYLEASGRLAGIGEGASQWELRDDNYIFAPLAEPGKAGENNTAGDWVGDRCLSRRQILASLKLYGRLVKIPEGKLTMRALRRTAVRLRLDQGAPLAELKTFLDSREGARRTKFRLGKLPQLPETDPGAQIVAQVPDRKGKPFQPGHGLTHGFFAHSQPEEAVLAVLAEDIQGVEAEIAGLRTLARGLVSRQVAARSSLEVAGLADAHSQAASRLAEMIAAEKKLAKEGVDNTWADDLLASMDKFAVKQGQAPVSEAIREQAQAAEPELAVTARRLVEEIASMRYMLRNVLGLALKTQEVPVFVRLVEIYGRGCARLVRMLKAEGSQHARLEKYLWDMADQAIDEVLKERGR